MGRKGRSRRVAELTEEETKTICDRAIARAKANGFSGEVEAHVQRRIVGITPVGYMATVREVAGGRTASVHFNVKGVYTMWELHQGTGRSW